MCVVSLLLCYINLTQWFPNLSWQSPSPPTQRSYSASSSPLPSVTPAREVDPEEESLNLSGLVAHRIAGEWLTGMSGLVFKFSSIVKVKLIHGLIWWI